ncbi:hypothetical protein DFJ73DRAFT_76828 [Zopfochytrium polystomum]|nr:hypothetical protein DFJ73DRAFT_76828 [Zopfochytrium polystomum]
MSSIADMKSAAVSAENFGQAKTLKTLYQLAKKAGEEIARLQVTKAKAIESEDYETAEDAKIDIEVIKSALRSKIGELGFRTTPVGGIEAIPEDILERQRQAARREIEASSTVKFKIPDETTVDEPREAQASRTPDDAPAPLVEEFPVISNSLSPNRRNQTPVTSPVQNLLKETTKVASPSGPSSRSVTNLNTEGRMPGDGGKSTKEKSSTEPEPLPADLDDALSHSAEVHGAYLVRCALSRQFKFREWAMEELAKRLDIWDRIQEQSGRTSLQHSSSPGRLARTEGGNQAGKRPVNEGPSRLGTERILSKESLFSSKESLSPKKGLTDVGSKASNDLVLTVFVDYEQEMPAPRVSPDVFLSSTLPIVRKGMDDIREKMTLQALAIWDEVTRLSTKYGIAPHSIYKNVEAMIPSLITKCGDMNSRVRQGSMELFATLAEAYHSVPYSICRSVLKSHTAAKQPGNGARSAVLPLRLTKARLEVLAFLVKEFGVDDPEAGRLREEETGLTIEAVMKAAKLELQHRSSEVREAAVRVIVELIVRAGEDVVADKLGNIPEQQMQLIRDKLAAARGVAALPRTRKRGATPWKSESLDDQKEDAVQKLQNELEALKDLVEESERKGPSRTRTRTYEKAKVAEAVKPIETASQTKQGQESTSRPPSANPVIAQTVTENTDKPKTAAEELADFAASWERICIFCEQSNPAFTEEALDIHYWKDCPMLTGCPLCNQIVEVPVLTSHMLTECDNRSLVKMCSRCQEAVLASEYLPHISRQTCMPASQVPGVSRCPLCHFDVPNGEQGWKRHLLHGNGCPEQERKPPPPRPIPRQPPPPNHEPVQPALKSPQRRAAREPTMTPMGLSPSLRTAGGSGSRATIRSSKPSPSPTPTSPASPASPVSPASPTGTRAASRASKTPVALKMRASPRTPAPMDGVKDGRRSGGVSTSAVGSSLEAKGSGTATVRARKSLESIQLAGGAGVGSTSVPGSFVGRGGLATAATGVASRKATVRRSTGNLK